MRCRRGWSTEARASRACRSALAAACGPPPAPPVHATAPLRYPWEEEILFAPLLGLEVLRTRVDGGVLVVMLRLTVNLTALSLEEQLSKRKRLVRQMCDALRDEL